MLDISNWIANLLWPQKFRDKRAKKLVKDLTGCVRIETRDNIVDFGSGHGEIPKEMARLGCLVTCIDLFTLFSKKVDNSEVRENMTWISGDATEKIVSLGGNSSDLVTMFYFLQALDEDGKKAAISEAMRILKANGKIVIVDEIYENWFLNILNSFVHYGLNLTEKSKGYNILKYGGYKQLFSEARLSVETECRCGNRVLYVLQKIQIS
ncbi:MAG: class I SAM-dependent methyltransferase [Candidatus Pacebacteria bacterium]|nr:class I SAM-dependent methyltransferase [Candidatus Paceibacterota bacterium]